MMRRKRIWCKLLILLGIAMILYVMYVINNWELYKLRAEMKSEYECVNEIKLFNNGPDCTISVYLSRDEYRYEDIEPIFIWAMKKVCSEDVLNFLKERHTGDVKGEIPFMRIQFYIETGTEENFLYRFDTFKDFEVWELDGDESVTYNISDYQ